MKRIFASVCFFVFAGRVIAQTQLSDLHSGADSSVPKAFAELKLEDTAGHLFSTSALLGKTVYVDFWFTTCSPCIKEIPYSACLQKFFVNDTSLVFLNICIENADRKNAWKQMIKDKEMKGIQLFYSRNRPQKVNLLREYDITFPTYLIINKEMKVIERDAPRPSEDSVICWLLSAASKDQSLSSAYKKMTENDPDYKTFTLQSLEMISACNDAKQPVAH